MVDQGGSKHSLFNFQEADIDKDCLRLHYKNANTSYTCFTRAYIPSFEADTPPFKNYWNPSPIHKHFCKYEPIQ